MNQQLTAANTIESALEDAIRLLKRRRVANDVTLDELKKINVELPRLQAQLALVSAQIVAFLAQDGSLPAPSAADFEQIRRNAAELDAIAAQNMAISGVLNLINQAVAIWRT